MIRSIRRRAATAAAIGAMVGGGLMAGAPAGAQTAVACGTVITVSTTLTTDVGPCATDGLIIGGSGVTLNLNGHKVFGAPAPGTQGAAAGQNVGVRFAGVSRSTVTNGEVSGFAAGVRVDGGAANSVTVIFAHDNIGPSGNGDNGDGIAVWNSNYDTIQNNRVVHNGPYSGLAVVTGPYNLPTDPAQTATGNRFLNNQVLNNNVSMCTASSGCVPRDPNTGQPVARVPQGQQTTASLDEGIRIEGPNATYSVVDSNVVSGSGNNGIFLMPSCRNAFMPPPASAGPPCLGDVPNLGTTVTNNTSDHNGYGRAEGSGINLFAMPGVLQVFPAAQELVSGNTARSNYTSGIQLFSTCSGDPTDAVETCTTYNNNVVRNTATNNRRDGITLGPQAFRNTVAQNTVDANGNDGIDLALATNQGVPIPGTGPTNNIIYANHGTGNAVFDGADETPGCDANVWMANVFVTVNQPCVRGNPAPAATAGTAMATAPAAAGTASQPRGGTAGI
ncbi:MAG: hypothetical protein ABR511_01675 [Acidimicrobiales bacterium]